MASLHDLIGRSEGCVVRARSHKCPSLDFVTVPQARPKRDNHVRVALVALNFLGCLRLLPETQ